MKRSDLEHILRASKGVTGETEFVVIGSQWSVSALLRHHMLRLSRLQALIATVEDSELRGRIAEALALCQRH